MSITRKMQDAILTIRLYAETHSSGRRALLIGIAELLGTLLSEEDEN